MTTPDNCEAIHAHLSLLQVAIARMASNSASTKTWCVTVVSGLVIVVADKGNPNMMLLAAFPTAIFFFLDAYYLALEKGFRAAHVAFVRKLHEGRLERSDLYDISPNGRLSRNFLSAAKSLSVWPLYGSLMLMVLLANAFVAL